MGIKLPSLELPPKFINLDLDSEPIERVLGVIWNVRDDFFVFKPLLKQYVYTKRGILDIVASIFYTLDILAQSILEAKLITQSLWAENVGWDDQIPSCLEERWSNWYQKINEITNVALPRSIGYDDKNRYFMELLISCPFVVNRLNKIRTNTEIRQWNPQSGDLNQAEMCSRYHLFQCLKTDSIWIRGPNILYPK